MSTGARKVFAALMLGLALSGCATNYVPVDSGFAATVISPGPAKLTVQTTMQNNGRVYGIMPVGGVFIGTSGKSPPHLLFNEVDQRTFGDAFAKELERLGLSPNATPSEGGQPAADIRLKFLSTAHNGSMQQYVLEATMSILGGLQPFEKTYKIDSNAGVSLGKKLNTNAFEGKQRGAQMLMKAMLADVQEWVRISAPAPGAAQQAAAN